MAGLLTCPPKRSEGGKRHAGGRPGCRCAHPGYGKLRASGIEPRAAVDVAAEGYLHDGDRRLVDRDSLFTSAEGAVHSLDLDYVLLLPKRDRIMRTLSSDTEDIKLRELIEAAREEPVTVLEKGKPVAVVLSPAEFDRLEEQDRIRREATTRLRRTISLIQREASDRGLTETELDRLMADES
jgi:prevent-host-death family protein